MNKNEYIQQLTIHLRGLPVAEQREILADYEEHFRLGTEVTAHLHGNVSNSRSFIPTIELANTDGKIDIQVVWPSKVVSGIFTQYLTLDVFLPGTYNGKLSVSASSGNIDTGDLNGNTILLHVSSGNIDAGTLRAANVTVGSSSGRITIGSIEAVDTQITSTSGNSTVTSVKSDKYRNESSSGNIRIGNLTSPAPYIKVTSGNITVLEGRGGINYQCISGRVNISFKEFSNQIIGESTSGNATVALRDPSTRVPYPLMYPHPRATSP